jgi:hypothetical protein
MAADPDALRPLVDDPLGPVESSFDLDAWRTYHCSHCATCSSGIIQPHCYFARVFHRLRFGWRIPLSFVPPKSVIDNYVSVREHKQRVCERYDELTDLGIFTPLRPSTDYAQPLQVVIRPKDKRKAKKRKEPVKIRVCMDASRNLNDFGPKWSFRYSDMSHVTRMLTKGCFCAAIDLSNFYLTIPLARASRKYCSFRDPRGGGFRSFKFVPFGLSNAPAWASAISSELCMMFRKAGVLRCSAYIDDVICVDEIFEECQ